MVQINSESELLNFNDNTTTKTDNEEEISNGINKLSLLVENEQCPHKKIREIQIEVRVKKSGFKNIYEGLCAWLRDYLKNELIRHSARNWRPLIPENVENVEFSYVDKILIGCASISDGMKLVLADEEIDSAEIHIYSVKEFGGMSDEISLGNPGEDSAVGSEQWEIPCLEFDDLWENLIYDDDLKNEFVSYVLALLELSDKGSNPIILGVNRLILLHGPPGTGKTSFCKALAQRLSVRLSNRYKRSLFIEVNSHSLFSKWFSESGKLILQLFSKIEELALHSNWLIFLLIDEVESLTIGRNAAFSGSDPSDSVRAVNAVLTQLDSLKKFTNVFVFTTSNISSQLDPAFVDRSDIVRFVGNPSIAAVISIFDSAIAEFIRIGVISQSNDSASQQILSEIAHGCTGLSGRILRKLPILAYTKCYLESQKNSVLSIKVFLYALEKVVHESVKGMNTD